MTPTFQPSNYPQSSIQEHISGGEQITKVTCVDKDNNGLFKIIYYKIAGVSPTAGAPYFTINNDGKISNVKPLKGITAPDLFTVSIFRFF